MLESLLKIDNFYWQGDVFQPTLEFSDEKSWIQVLQNIKGQFSFAFCTTSNKIVLTRDQIGINKLFFAIRESGKVYVSNYLSDLVESGIPFEAIFSVPAGHFAVLDSTRKTITLNRYFELNKNTETADALLEDLADNIRKNLELWFSNLGKAFNSQRICLCLSGGLDSGVIAAFAKKYFSNVIGYTYTYLENGAPISEDAVYARRLADFLGIPFRLIPASSNDILNTLDNAIYYGQDWRDFNVHCALVNQILGQAIAKDMRAAGENNSTLVLTGDLMNEYLADYSPVNYENKQYYKLPRLSIGDLRIALIRGLDAGDREVGVFNYHNLKVLQPYGLLLQEYLKLPDSFIASKNSKQKLVKLIAGDLLPPFIFERVKVRAQIGNSSQPTGILPVLVNSGRDSKWLKNRFCNLFNIHDNLFLNRFIRAGVYRYICEFPKRGYIQNGFITTDYC